MGPSPSRIVAATDFSQGADRAVVRALLLGSAYGIPVEHVHVVSEPGLATLRRWLREPADVADRVVSAAGAQLAAAAGALGVPYRLALGDVVGRLREATSPDTLLVVGARGEGPLADLLIGSTAERIVAESAGPVLVVRGDARGPYRNVVAGMDLESGCPDLLGQAAALFPEARITAVHAYWVPFEGMLHRAGVSPPEIERFRADALARATESIRAAARDATGDAGRVLALAERGDPARLVVEHGKSLDADLLVVARRSRPRAHALLIGSVARRVVAGADRDVLVLRGPAGDAG